MIRNLAPALRPRCTVIRPSGSDTSRCKGGRSCNRPLRRAWRSLSSFPPTSPLVASITGKAERQHKWRSPRRACSHNLSSSPSSRSAASSTLKASEKIEASASSRLSGGGGEAAAASPVDITFIDDNASQKPLPVQEVAFPWRPAPRRPAAPRYASYGEWFTQILFQATLRGTFNKLLSKEMECLPRAVQERLFRYMRFAFIQGVRGIFDGQCKTPRPTLEFSREDPTPPSSTWDMGYPPLSAMMDEALVMTYKDVMARFKANKREVRLELESIVPVAMHDYRMSMGPPRGSPQRAAMAKHKFFGLTTFSDQPIDIDGPMTDTLAAYVRVMSRNPRIGFHIAVTFRCRELFCVRNTDTGEVLQGEDGIREVDHVARFDVELDQKAQVMFRERKGRRGRGRVTRFVCQYEASVCANRHGRAHHLIFTCKSGCVFDIPFPAIQGSDGTRSLLLSPGDARLAHRGHRRVDAGEGRGG